MLFGDDHQNHGDDYFSDTRMSFGDHIEDLRTHLIRAIVGFLVASVGCFFISPWILTWISAPVEQELEALNNRRITRLIDKIKADPQHADKFEPREEEEYLYGPDLGMKADKKDPWVKVRRKVTPKPEDLQFIQEILVKEQSRLRTGSVQGAFVVYLQVSLVAGLVVGSPWIFYQIWAFIAAGLYPHEKKLVNVYLPFSVVLFAGGVIFCYWIVMPRAIEALLWFNEWLGFEPLLDVGEWLSFAIWVPVVFGLSFQTPLVMMFLERIGIGTLETYRAFRRYAYFGLAVVAAVVSPTIDPQTMLFMWAPMCLFYELGIVLCRLSPRRRWLDELTESEEMIEV